MVRNHSKRPRSPASPHKRRAGRANNASDRLYGLHAVRAALANPRRECLRLWLTAEAKSTLDLADPSESAVLPERATQAVAQASILARAALDALVPAGTAHQGVVLDTLPLPNTDLAEACAPAHASRAVIVLDQVEDPHNVGAILRSAAAFHARAVVVQERHSPPASGALAKSASGALESVPLVRVTNLSRAIEELKDLSYQVIGLDGAAHAKLSDTPLAPPVALVLGAEGKGMRRLTRERCDLLAGIPIAGAMASLNVSNAAAIALYELERRSDKQ